MSDANEVRKNTMVNLFSLLLPKLFLIGLVLNGSPFPAHANDIAPLSEITEAVGADASSPEAKNADKAPSELPPENASCTVGRKKIAVQTYKKYLGYFKNKCESLSGNSDDRQPTWADLAKMIGQKKQNLLAYQPSHHGPASVLGNLRTGRWSELFSALGVDQLSEESPAFQKKLNDLKFNYSNAKNSDLPLLLKPLLDVSPEKMKDNPSAFAEKASHLESIFLKRKVSPSALLGRPHQGIVVAIKKLIEENKAEFSKASLAKAEKKLKKLERTIRGVIQSYKSYSLLRKCQTSKGYYLWNRDWLIRKCGAESIAEIDDHAVAEGVPCPPAKDAGKPLGDKAENLRVIVEQAGAGKREELVKPKLLVQCSSSLADRAECVKHQKNAEARIQPVIAFLKANKKELENKISNELPISSALKKQSAEALMNIKAAREECDLILPVKGETPTAETRKMHEDCYASLEDFKSDGTSYLMLKIAADYDRYMENAQKRKVERSKSSE